jgi:phosphatidylserine/phosphatidylglycerophosphate/cardiolipin synthase-like enzyme
VEPTFHDVDVGLARTEPAWRNLPEVRESEALHLAAIASARRHIYLENQYVASPAMGEALAARLGEPDGPEVLIVSTEHSPSWFDRMTMDKTRSALIRRLQDADKYGRFHAFCPETDSGKTIIVHAKCSIIDDEMLRAGSTNLNNRSTGFDTEADIAIEAAAGPAGDGTRAAIAQHRWRTIAHFLAKTPEAVEAAAMREGSLAGAIQALDDGPLRRLRRLGPVAIGPLAAFIAAHHLGDPLTPGDSWRPWRRRKALRQNLLELAPQLADAPLLTDRQAGISQDARSGDHRHAAEKPNLKDEDFMPTD